MKYERPEANIVSLEIKDVVTVDIGLGSSDFEE